MRLAFHLSMRLNRLIVLLISLAVLTSCSTITRHNNNQVMLGEGVSLTLTPAPSSLLNVGFLTQVNGTAGNIDNKNNGVKESTVNHYEMLMQTEISTAVLTMVGMTANGLELFQLQWQAEQPIVVNRSAMASKIKVEYLLADFQLVHWPIDRLNQQLKGAIVSEQLGPQARRQTRQIRADGQTIISIEYHYEPDVRTPSKISLTNHLRHYQFSLKTLDKWKL